MLQVSNESVVARGALPLLGTVLLYYLYVYWLRAPAVFDAPIEGVRKHGQGVNTAASNTVQILKTNYLKYRNRFFKIREPHGDVLILPIQYLEELKSLPEDLLSFEGGTSNRMMGKYTLMTRRAFGNHGDAFNTSVGQNLTRNLSHLMKDIYEECQYAFEKHIGPCEGWTEVRIFEKLVVIVALISGRIFIGPEMNRDPEYMRCIIKYTMEVFQSVGALQQIHPWLRGLYARMGWVPELNQVHQSHSSMRKILGPMIEQRLEALKAGEELPNDMLTWNMVNSPPDIQGSIKVQAHNQLQASMAAIHTTSMTGSHILYDLAFRPECIKPLREELEAVMAQEKVPYLSKTSTPKLKLLDSFCKESQRINPLGQLTFNRLVMKDIALHDGVVIPAGTQISVVAGERMKADDEVYVNANTFDPWRFYEMRREKGHESRYQFVAPSHDSLGFGYGVHACPGRFFANNELKVILAYVLAHYDVKMPEGQGRPENIATVGGARPDTSKAILMRKQTKISL